MYHVSERSYRHPLVEWILLLDGKIVGVFGTYEDARQALLAELWWAYEDSGDETMVGAWNRVRQWKEIVMERVCGYKISRRNKGDG